MTDPAQVVSFRVDPDMLAELRDIANAQGCSLSDLLRRGALMAVAEPNTMVIAWMSAPTVTLGSPQTDRPIADIAVSSAADTGLIGVGLAAGGILVEADLDHEKAGELRDMLADAMGAVGVAPHSGDPQMTCAEVEQQLADALERLAVLERQIAAVRSLHRPYRDVYATAETGDSCEHCNGFTDAYRVPWPCPTAQAIEEVNRDA